MDKSAYFLGVDGGQSHTEAIIADCAGNVLSRGTGGASNHAEQPGGRERLRNAVVESVGSALAAMLPGKGAPPRQQLVAETVFAAAHFGMTGGADYKEEIIAEIVRAERLRVGHDAPTALYGATAGTPGVVVIAGTGSVVYGENAAGETARVGGLGFLFSDEGSGFWLAAETIRLAIREADGLLEEAGLERLVLDFFKVGKIRDLTTAFYNGKVTRDEIAALAKAAQAAAENGSEVLQERILTGAEVLVRGVRCAADKLKLPDGFAVATVGGMFRGAPMRAAFAGLLKKIAPQANLIEPRFGPAFGALLLAYSQAGVTIDDSLLANLEKAQK